MSFRQDRKEETRSYKRLFLIAAEGANTERSYFDGNIRYLIGENDVDFHIVSYQDSFPLHVLEALEGEIENRKNELSANDEAWIVIDRDQWKQEHIQEVIDWVNGKPKDIFRRDLALSNPCFEFWLILHFEDGKELFTTEECKNKLKEYIKLNRNKVPEQSIQREQVKNAIPTELLQNGQTCYNVEFKVG